MTTLVFFHAHPDDESIQTGGTMAAAAAAGHRVVLVLATRGERGEPVEGVLDDGEMLWERRISETYRSAQVLGAQRVEFLGYVDSGMMGEESNGFPYSFWTADVDAAAHRLAAILTEEDASILVAYDDHGGYGHPDHIQVHRVGLRAAELAGTSKVLQATMNRDHIVESLRAAAAQMESDGVELPDNAPSEEDFDTSDFGSPASLITHAVDVREFIDSKRGSMTSHASQIAADSWFLTMDDDQFAMAFGTEWYIETGAPRAEGAPFITALWDDATSPVQE